MWSRTVTRNVAALGKELAGAWPRGGFFCARVEKAQSVVRRKMARVRGAGILREMLKLSCAGRLPALPSGVRGTGVYLEIRRNMRGLLCHSLEMEGY